MEWRPLPGEPEFGCEVQTSMKEIMESPALLTKAQALLAERGLLLFREAELTPAEETAFVKLFGWDDVSPFDDVAGPYMTAGTGIVDDSAIRWKIPSFPAIQLQGNGAVRDHYDVPNGTLVANNKTREWHTDGCHDVLKSLPPIATSMYCLKTPTNGHGETLFASGRHAFSRLTPQLQARALQLDAVYDLTYRPMDPDGCRASMTKDEEPVTTRFPIVIQDQTGEPSLYVGPAFTKYLVDRQTGRELSPEKSQKFLGTCLHRGLKVYEHKWRPKDFVLWCNRCLLHSATETNKYTGHDRLHHRIRMASKLPVIPYQNQQQTLIYARLWAFQQLLSSGAINYLASKVIPGEDFNLASQTTLSPQFTVALWIAYIGVLVKPLNRPLLIGTHLINLVVHAIKIPFVWDYEVWDFLIELSVILLPSPASLARSQLLVFYYATAFYKFTKSFLSRQVSCGSIFVFAILDLVVPKGLDPSPTVLTMINALSPAMTIFIEVLIPTLLFLTPGIGILVGLVFHLLITLQPPPNNAGGFSVSIAVRYAFFLQGQSGNWSPLYALIAVPLVAVAVAIGSDHGSDWSVPVHVIMSLALVPPALATIRSSGPPRRKKTRSFTAMMIIGLTMLYAVGMPLLGGDMVADTMFSNLRVYSRSNHLIAPTGLLLNTTTLRIDATTSDFINNQHPNEATSLHSPRLTRWLRSAGHRGRQFAPYLKRTIGITVSKNQGTVYFIPDLELRRLVQEAYDHGETSFRITYTKLPSLDRVVFDAKKGRCQVFKEGGKKRTKCGPEEAVLNPGLSFLQSKFLLFFSFPVPPNATSLDDVVELGCIC